MTNLLLNQPMDDCTPLIISLGSDGRYGPMLRKRNFHVHSLNLGNRSNAVFALWRFRKIVQEFKPDIIQGWMYHGNLFASLASLWVDHQTAVSWNIRQSLDDIKTEKLLTAIVIRLLAKISNRPKAIVYNSFHSKRLHEEFGFSSDASEIIPNGFDIKNWRPNIVQQQQVRSELRLSNHDLLVGFVGRHHYQKDITTFLSGCKLAMEQLPDLHVALVGEGLDENNATLLQSCAGLRSHNLHLLGRRSDVERIMTGFDIFGMSSISEAFPNVLGEAMATALPCIATDVGDCKRLLDGCGIIVAPQSPVQISEAILHYSSMSLTHRKQIGQSAREKIASMYTIQNMVSKYLDLYRKIADN